MGAAGVCEACVGAGEEVRGVENGCAAEVEVAAGGPSWLPEAGPRGEPTVSSRKEDGEVEKTRCLAIRLPRSRFKQR